MYRICTSDKTHHFLCSRAWTGFASCSSLQSSSSQLWSSFCCLPLGVRSTNQALASHRVGGFVLHTGQDGPIWDKSGVFFFKSDFNTFWLHESEKVIGWADLGSNWVRLAPNRTNPGIFFFRSECRAVLLLSQEPKCT